MKYNYTLIHCCVGGIGVDLHTSKIGKVPCVALDRLYSQKFENWRIQHDFESKKFKFSVAKATLESQMSVS